MAETPAPDGSAPGNHEPEKNAEQPAAAPPAGPLAPLERNTVIDGRYRVEELLGRGGFGQVYRCVEIETGKIVAVKVLRPDHAAGPWREKLAARFRAEAQTVAGLEHPNIVPVRYWGQTDEIPLYIVMDYVPGISLAQRLMQATSIPYRDAVLWIIEAAKALVYAHTKGVLHLDVKPANILLQGAVLSKGPERILLTDFGLALRDDQRLRRGRDTSGTPAFMSPEQARGETDRIGAWTDVYGLGATLYTILAGKPPFRGTNHEILQQVEKMSMTPPSLRSLDPDISEQLERICSTALSKQPSERYATPQDMLDELREFLRAGDQLPAPGTGGGPGREPAKIVPKGLRPFDKEDADFFLRLVPGALDRHGIPAIIRGWKTKIEATDQDEPLAVALIYGPSGCGKSSLVCAGLLPRLDKQRVRSVYVRATSGATERTLRERLRGRYPDLPPDLDLVETVRAVRDGQAGAAGVKTLIVLDQFEQWLAVHHHEADAELLDALRLCSQPRVQCLLLVRNGFLAAAKQCMRTLDIPLKEHQSWWLIEPFSTEHAVKVLTEFGRAYDRFEAGVPSAEQTCFMEQAVAAMAKDKTVICIELALYAWMIKDQPWLPGTLKGPGSLRAVGKTFLEQSFAPGTVRHEYEQPARRVLERLLPKGQVPIINVRRSQDELLQVSGYVRRPDEFHDLIRVLGDDLPLIMQVEPERDGGPDAGAGTDCGDAGHGDTSKSPESGTELYRLTHEYLLDPLRTWLEDGDRKTRRGRAKLALRQRTRDWKGSNPTDQDKRDGTYLPGPGEYLRILCLAPRSEFGEDQKDLMRAAHWRYAKWAGLLGVAAVLVGLIVGASVWMMRPDPDVSTLVSVLLRTDAGNVRSALDDLSRFPDTAKPLIESQFEAAAEGSQDELRAAYWLAANSRGRQDVLEHLLDQVAVGPRGEFANIVEALAYDREAAFKRICTKFDGAAIDVQVRLATLALHLGNGDSVDRDLRWDHFAAQMLRLKENPEPRTAFIHGYPNWHGDLEQLNRVLRKENVDPDLSSGLCAAVGLMTSKPDRDKVLATINQLYQHARDGGTHSAAAFALTRWQETDRAIQIPELKRRNGPPEEAPGWFVNSLNMTLVRIPAGEFVRGDDGCDENEKPAHKVKLTRDFFLAAREVTVAQFLEFLRDDKCPLDEKRRNEWLKELKSTESELPMTSVDWEEAVQFCNWLSEREELKPVYVRTGRKVYVEDFLGQPVQVNEWEIRAEADGYRLPTEAQWEYGCRARSQTRFHFGTDDQLLEYGWYSGNSLSKVHPVGTKLPNGWGLFDMHGNVWEWCSDWYGEYAPGEVRDPTGSASSWCRVFRGGCWYYSAESCRSAVRSRNSPSFRYADLGFRVARSSVWSK